jgi:hypothetical protein
VKEGGLTHRATRQAQGQADYGRTADALDSRDSGGEFAGGWLLGSAEQQQTWAREALEGAAVVAQVCSVPVDTRGGRRRWKRTRPRQSSWADAEGERGLECSVQRGWRMVLGVEYGADRRCMAGGKFKGGLEPRSRRFAVERQHRQTGCAVQQTERWRGAGRSEECEACRSVAEEGTGATEARTGSGHGVGEPKAGRRSAQRRGSCR